MLQEMPQVHHLSTGEFLVVRLMHQVMLSANLDAELVIALLLCCPDFLEQRDDIHPLQIVRRWMPEQGFERSQVRPVQRRTPLRSGVLSATSFSAFHFSGCLVDEHPERATTSPKALCHSALLLSEGSQMPTHDRHR